MLEEGRPRETDADNPSKEMAMTEDDRRRETTGRLASGEDNRRQRRDQGAERHPAGARQPPEISARPPSFPTKVIQGLGDFLGGLP